MLNPFDVLLEKIDGLQQQVSELKLQTTPPIEIINRDELCKRLDITEPTAIRWEKKGKIPSFRIGSNIRYNWPSVVEALTK